MGTAHFCDLVEPNVEKILIFLSGLLVFGETSYELFELRTEGHRGNGLAPGASIRR